jgi:hypothetical protein
MFNLRVIELVATAIRQLGAILYQINLRLHDGDVDSVVNWSMPPDLWGNVWEVPKPPPTLFNLPHYMTHDIYPEGATDMVGYCTEDRILSGVVTEGEPQDT